MIEGLKTIRGVQAVGLVDRSPLYYGANSSNVFTDTTTDLRPKNAVAEAMLYNISPEYFDAARTALLTGRSLTWHDDRNASPVAVVNREFADRIFGSVTGAVGGYFKRRDGTRIQVLGIVENGKYGSVTEDLQPAMFLPNMQQTPVNETLLVVPSNRDPKQLTAALRSKLHELDAGLPADIQTWDQQLYGALFAAHMATISLGVLGVMGRCSR